MSCAPQAVRTRQPAGSSDRHWKFRGAHTNTRTAAWRHWRSRFNGKIRRRTHIGVRLSVELCFCFWFACDKRKRVNICGHRISSMHSRHRAHGEHRIHKLIYSQFAHLRSPSVEQCAKNQQQKKKTNRAMRNAIRGPTEWTIHTKNEHRSDALNRRSRNNKMIKL